MKPSAHTAKSMLNPAVRQELQSAAHRWQTLLFVRLASYVTGGVALAFLALGFAVLKGVIADWVPAILIAVLFVFIYLLALVVLAVVALSRTRPTRWLAISLERHFPRLLDRVNTLVFLETKKRDATVDAYFRSIGKQAGQALTTKPKGSPISPVPAISHVAVAILLCVGTIWFHAEYQPWTSIEQQPGIATALNDSLELNLPEETSAVVRKSWGEVRITEPGGDLKLTKVDVLSLTIEAATSQQLAAANWTTAINGGTATPRSLPPPTEPNYAVYQPSLFLDELGLADWDVVSYFASASTSSDNHYGSEMFFVEVRPFREDLLKLEGGGSGQGGACLKKLSQLIKKEQNILRQTHRQTAAPAAASETRTKDQEKLTAAQTDNEKATGHLYAEVATMENQGIGTVLDQLALSQQSMREATDQLAGTNNPTAMEREQLALQQLVESRKHLAKIVADNANANGQSGEENPPVAGEKKNLDGQIADIAGFRDEGKAALEAVRQAREEQQAIADEARSAKSPEARAALADRQRAAAGELRKFQENTPKPFEGIEPSAKAAISAMDNSASKLESRQTGNAPARAALDAVAKLEQDLKAGLTTRALTDAYRLKKMLDAQSEKLGEMQGAGAGPGEVGEATKSAKSAKDALADSLRESPAGKAFGPGLGEALAGQPGQQLDRAAQQAASDPSSAAGQARQALQSIAKAFEASQPAALQGAQGTSLAAGDDGIGDAIRALSSLAARADAGMKTSPEDIRKQFEEARLALLSETTDADNPALLALSKDIEGLRDKVNLDVDPIALKKLVDRLENYRVELAGKAPAPADDPALRAADSAEAPVEFRERVRRYFEKLSRG